MLLEELVTRKFIILLRPSFNSCEYVKLLVLKLYAQLEPFLHKISSLSSLSDETVHV